MGPNDSAEPPNNHQNHLIIVGASHCGVQAAFYARRSGYEGGITLISNEQALPYHRPPLSKDVLTGAKNLDQIALRPQRAYDKAEIDLRLGQEVTRIDRQRQVVELDSGQELPFTSLLLCTGARPRRLPVPGEHLNGIHYLRTAADAYDIGHSIQPSEKVVVVGGGYIGLEAAASLRKLGCEVTVLEAMPRVLQRVASTELSEFYGRLHQEEGVVVLTDTALTGFEGDAAVSQVVLDNGTTLPADKVVIGIGVVPNVELAEQAGLAVDSGILVDGQARTSDSAIFAAGDCARGYHGLFDQHLRVESVQNANDQAKIAVDNLQGGDNDYDALPWFWSDQYNVKLQIAGLIEGADQCVVRGSSTHGRSFSLCHLKGSALVAVEAVNQPRDFLAAKTLIVDAHPMNLDALRDSNNPLASCVQAE